MAQYTLEHSREQEERDGAERDVGPMDVVREVPEDHYRIYDLENVPPELQFPLDFESIELLEVPANGPRERLEQQVTKEYEDLWQSEGFVNATVKVVRTIPPTWKCWTAGEDYIYLTKWFFAVTLFPNELNRREEFHEQLLEIIARRFPRDQFPDLRPIVVRYFAEEELGDFGLVD